MAADLLPILLQGVALGASLCLTLGPQSLFVLRQGMRGERALQVAAACTFSDVAMIVAGASGFGAFIAAFPSFGAHAGWIGSTLVFIYGGALLAGALRQAWVRRAAAPPPCRAGSCVIASALALAFFNPQVYLEMVGVVGSVAIRFDGADRAMFALGVMLVSPLWFFGLAVAGRRVARLLHHERAVFALDLGTASLMLGLGTSMVLTDLPLP